MKKSVGKSLSVLAGLCISLSLYQPEAEAAILYWNNNGLSTPTSGVWDTTTPQWSTTDSLTDTPVVWDTNAAVGVLSLPAPASNLVLTVNSPIDFAGSFNGFNAGSGVTNGVTNLIYSGSGSLNLVNGQQAFWTGLAAYNTMVRVPVTGTGGMQHQGYGGVAGSLYLGATNTFSGGFSFGVNSGVNINNGNAFGTGPITMDYPSIILAIPAIDSAKETFATNAMTITNEVMTYPGSCTNIFVGLQPASGSAPVTFTGPMTLRGGAGTTTTFDVRNTNWTFAGPISGAANFRKKQAATLILSGSNTFSGSVLVENGILTVNSINTVVGGAPSSSLGAPTTAADGLIALGTTTTAGVLLYVGDGETSDRVVDLAGTTGGATIQNDGAGALIFTSGFTASGAGAKTLTLTGTSASSNAISGAIVDNSAANLTSVTKASTGRWGLFGANTYSGPTKVNRGFVVVNSINRVSGPSASSGLGRPTTVANGTIALGSSTTAGGLLYVGAGETSDRVINLSGTTGGATIQSDGTGPLVLTSDFTATGAGIKTVTLQGTNTSDNRISGKIVNSTAATAVNKTQAGTWTLAGANTFTGNMTFSSGRLNLAHPGALGFGTNVIGGTSSFDNFTGANLSVTNPLLLNGGSPTYIGSSNNMTYTGPVAISGANRSITVSSNTLTLASGIDDLGQGRAFTKAGAGTLVTVGANSYTGNTTISAGTLALGASSSLASTNNITISASGILDVSAISSYVMGGTNSLTATGSNTVVGVSAAVIKGGTSVNLGTHPIALTFRPTAFTGDTGHPSLVISQGTLSLSGNAFTVNNASGTALGAGTYQLVQQVSGNISSTGTHTVTVTGNGLVANATASLVVTGGDVNLVVSVPAVGATISTPTLLGNGSVQLNFSGTAGVDYVIQAATNLNPPVVWSPLSTNTADGSGLFNYTDTEATNYVERYYRAQNQ